MTSFTQWDVQHLSNTCTVYKVRKDAPPQDIVAFLIRDAEQLAELRQEWLKNGEDTIRRIERDRNSKRPDSAGWATEQDRLVWHVKRQDKTRRELGQYQKLALKLKEFGLPKNLSWL